MISRPAAKKASGKLFARPILPIVAASVAVGSGSVMPPTAIAKGNVVVQNESEEQKLLRAKGRRLIAARSNNCVHGDRLRASFKALVRKKKGYPYVRPDTSFLFVRGEVLQFDNRQWRGLNHLHEIVGSCGSSATDFAAAHGMDLVRLSREELFWPVLAIGSNAGPEQLRRKYPLQDFPDCVIPVVQVALEDFDVVYAPYIATYGSCTATLEHSPGTVTYIFITYLTGPLMERMHATEGGYNLCRLLGLRLHVAPWSADGNVQRENNQMRNADDKTCAKEGLQVAFRSFEIRDWVYQYNHKLGCIKLPFKELGGSPVAIAAIPAERRTFPAASQVQMLTTLMTALDKTHEGPLSPLPAFGDVCEKISSKALDDWLLHLIKNSTARSAICKRLSLHAQMFFYPNCEVIADM